MENNNHAFRIAVEEAKAAFQNQMESIKAIKNNSTALFGSASLVLSIISSLQILRPVPKEYFLPYLILLGLAGCIYILYFLLSIRIIASTELFLPILNDTQEYTKLFLNRSEKDILSDLLDAYLQAIHKNESIIIRRKNLSQLSNLLISLLVITLLVLAVVPSIPQLQRVGF